mmetsp:Transcript_28833/g.51343  ORF Transcript_28833/g.51343 Transcript_28833/m.51343 type:complete len:468 (-) Transcript_28833:80-1483(-)
MGNLCGKTNTDEGSVEVDVMSPEARVFAPDQAMGGCQIDPATTAVLCIEFQNEFTTDGGKLYPAVKDVMAQTDMLKKAADVCKTARDKGAKVIHAPIMFKEDGSDNPNKNLGILAGCAKDKLFTEGTWNSEFCDAMKPVDGDLIVQGKKGLDAFPGTDLEALLVKNGIQTLALCGFLTNCCVESTMRSAFERGFNTVTLTDCCATTSAEGHKGATEGTFGMFSTPKTAEAFAADLKSASAGTASKGSMAMTANNRYFTSAQAKGGTKIDPKTTAVVCIEFQNEFTTEGGKLYPAVKECIQSTDCVTKAAGICKLAREKGAKVIMAPIMFKADNSDNPNKSLGILAGCANDSLFTENTWNSEFCEAMKPQAGDLVVKGKKGLDAFPGTDLEELLVKNNIETVALCGFLTNCCVESTMRTAFEKGFNTVTLTDCCATTSMEGQTGATEGTYGMFSKPLTAEAFGAELSK